MLKQIKTGGSYTFEGQPCTVVARVPGSKDRRVHVKFASGKERVVDALAFRLGAEEV